MTNSYTISDVKDLLETRLHDLDSAIRDDMQHANAAGAIMFGIDMARHDETFMLYKSLFPDDAETFMHSELDSTREWFRAEDPDAARVLDAMKDDKRQSH